MIAFQIVTLGVAMIGIVAAVFISFSGGGPLASLGRSGQMWFHHAEDLALSEQPSEDERDAPIPRRRLRGRPD